MRIPATLAELGTALHIEWDSGGESLRGCILATNGSKNTLYIFPARGARKAAPCTTGKQAAAWRLWSDFEVDGARRVKVPEPEMELVGPADYIIYSSDKWGGKKNRYIHEFESPVEVYRGKKKSGLWVLKGGKLKVRAAGITG